MLHPAMLHLAMLHPAMLHQSSSFITLHLQPLHRHSLHWALTPAMPCTHKIKHLITLCLVPGAGCAQIHGMKMTWVMACSA